MSRSDPERDNQDLTIAIIGMAGRFPGARNVGEFWENLCNGAESISFFSEQELLEAGGAQSLIEDPNYVKAYGALDDIDLFDASFFGISPNEAEIMDPQQRIFLEVAWEALENAGYDPEGFRNPIGIYAGTGANSYWLNVYSNPDLIRKVGWFSTVLANDKDFLTTRVSYKLNLKGPSVTVQTSCSTSLVAVHLACQGLLSGNCDMALAGGISINTRQKAGYHYQEGGINSPDGHCRAFDAAAKGTVGGSGVGVVVMKRLEDALTDGANVLALIRGSAINNDGSLKAGFTAPSLEAQAQVIRAAHLMAEVDSSTITYIETHGTGTELGDPIEIAALTEAFRNGPRKKQFCAIGSVKTNIGHLDCAAGVAGLIKTVLALKHRMIPPSLHFERANPKIDFEESPFYVNTALQEWKTSSGPRRAGVSSFGIGGTNAHVVLEEPMAQPSSGPSRPWRLLALSARTELALETMTAKLIERLKAPTDLQLADIASTLQQGRKVFNHRRVVIARSRDEAAAALETLDPECVFTSYSEHKNLQVVFMFPGQGAQHVNMGKALYRDEPTFRRHVDFCSDLLKTRIGLDLREILFPLDNDSAQARLKLDQTYLTQPALFIIESALARLWMEWGVRPKAMIGHSVGEYTAAYLAGVLSLEDGLKLVAARGRMMQELPGGDMLAVPMSKEKLGPLIEGKLSLAAINTPAMCVISGTSSAVREFEKKLKGLGVLSHRVHTSHAFHSEMMDPILEAFSDVVRSIRLNPPQIPFISNLTGTWIQPQEATDANYWTKHLRQTVNLSDGLSEILKDRRWVLLEVGPGTTLSALARSHPDKTPDHLVFSSMRHREKTQSDMACLLNTLGRLWLAGVEVDWRGFYVHERRRRVALPAYPFERQRFWITAPKPASNAASSDQRSSGRKPDIADWFYAPSWTRSVTVRPAEALSADRRRMLWLLLLDAGGVGERMARRLRQMGQNVITVAAGERFTTLGPDNFRIDPRFSEDYHSLLAKLRELEKAPDVVAHLWLIDGVGRNGEVVDISRLQHLGFYSLLFFAQAFTKYFKDHSARICVVSTGLHQVLGGESLSPEKATVLGPCKVIPQEFPNLACRNIDLEALDPERVEQGGMLDNLIIELAGRSSDQCVAYRGKHRWVRSFVPVKLESSLPLGPRIRDKGVYLITGGLGGIGLTLAEELVRRSRARLILVSRSPIPDRSQWSAWLEDNRGENVIGDRIRRLMLLESLGAEILTLSANVADLEQLRSVKSIATERFGKIHGVIHAAGVAGGSLIEFTTPEIASETLASKVEGTLALEALFKDERLDFMALCSSLASVLGGLGQAGYCAANAFLDAYALRCASQGDCATISINWDTWREVGMALKAKMVEEFEERRESNLKRGITSAEGVEAFVRILDAGLPQVLVSTDELRTRVSQSEEFKLAGALQLIRKERRARRERPDMKRAYKAPQNDTERVIAEMWGDLLGIEFVGADDNFLDLGGHSLLAIQLISRLRDTFKVEIPVKAIFETPTVAALAVAIETLLWYQRRDNNLMEVSVVGNEEGEI